MKYKYSNIIHDLYLKDVPLLDRKRRLAYELVKELPEKALDSIFLFLEEEVKETHPLLKGMKKHKQTIILTIEDNS